MTTDRDKADALARMAQEIAALHAKLGEACDEVTMFAGQLAVTQRERDALRAQVRALRLALGPFAALAEDVDTARAALAATEVKS